MKLLIVQATSRELLDPGSSRFLDGLLPLFAESNMVIGMMTGEPAIVMKNEPEPYWEETEIKTMTALEESGSTPQRWFMETWQEGEKNPYSSL